MGEQEFRRIGILPGKQEPAMPEAVYERPWLPGAEIYKGLKPGDEIPFGGGCDK